MSAKDRRLSAKDRRRNEQKKDMLCVLWGAPPSLRMDCVPNVHGEKIPMSEYKKFYNEFWKEWYERELNASSDTCMHNHSSGVHEYLMRTRSKDATLVYICKHCLEIVSPLEPLADE